MVSSKAVPHPEPQAKGVNKICSLHLLA